MVEPETVDFGVVDPGAKLPTVFRLRNVGNAPLTLSGAVPSCKCTTVTGIAGTVIAPGETFELPATLDAPTYPGVKESRITLIFQGHRMPVNANMRCDVALSVRVVEEFIDALEDRTSGTITVESRDGKPFRILSSNGTAPVYVGFDPARDEPRSSYSLRWSVAGWACAGMRLWWIIETDRADCPILPARIRHDCTGGRADPNRFTRKWMVSEQIVNAGRIKAGEPVMLRIGIENSEPKMGANRPATFDRGYLEISSVTSTSPDAAAKMRGVIEGSELDATLHFEFTPAATARGLVYAVVRIESPNGPADLAVVASVEAP